MRQLLIAGLVLTAVMFVGPPLSVTQNMPALSVLPSKVSMLVGETHEFRAVGKDGRIRHNLRWNVVPAYAATLTQSSDEVTVKATTVPDADSNCQR
jgi:hypothetical protein